MPIHIIIFFPLIQLVMRIKKKLLKLLLISQMSQCYMTGMQVKSSKFILKKTESSGSRIERKWGSSTGRASAMLFQLKKVKEVPSQHNPAAHQLPKWISSMLKAATTPAIAFLKLVTCHSTYPIAAQDHFSGLSSLSSCHLQAPR